MTGLLLQHGHVEGPESAEGVQAAWPDRWCGVAPPNSGAAVMQRRQARLGKRLPFEVRQSPGEHLNAYLTLIFFQRHELDEKIAQVSKERQELASKIKEVSALRRAFSCFFFSFSLSCHS